MKKFLPLLLLLAFFAAQLGAQVVVNTNITTNTTWTKNNTYLLDGFIYVKNGATLTIEPGTRITGSKINKGTLIVTRGSKLIASGTPNEPIVFTSAEANPTYGDWGGIIILGRASTNANFMGTAGLGQIEGGVNNAEGDGLYGGGDLPGGAINNDNSGELRYVRIEYGGIAFQPNNEINGLTMGGVGSGTTIEYVQVSYANDDAFEWFGGTVNCRYLIAYRALDDDFDADNGYTGKVQFALSIRDQDIADVSGSNGFEVDNDAQGTATTPLTAPTFSNVTIVGPNGGGSNLYRRALHLRRNNQIGVFNSVFVGSYPVGLLIDGTTTLNNANAGTLDVRNSYFYGQGVALDTTPGSILDITAWGNARGLVTGANSTDAKLIDPFNIALPNPKPADDSPVLNGASFSNSRVADNFFIQVKYAGAFGNSGDWTCPWASWAQPGCIPAQEVVVSGAITSDQTWTADKEYVLNGFVYVKNCATLTIEPGTVIRGDKSTKGALIVTRCAKIIADGTPNAPIVFTTNDPNPTYGSWGGLIILGRASTNANFMGTAGLGQIEGGVNNAAGDGLYGGGDLPGGAINNDNSGVLRYVRIEYAGIAFQPNNEINGLTLGAVGSGTTVEYVQVSYANDDAFEWFGGTVNCRYLIAYRALDDDFDADNGYTGKVQFALSIRDQDIADVSGSNGFEVDNDAQGTATTPITAPTFSNVTIVGPNGGGSNLYRRALHLRRNNQIGVFNSVFVGSYPVGLLIDGSTTLNNANAGTLDVRNSFFYGQGVALDTTPGTILDITAWGNARGLVTGTNSADAKLLDPFNIGLPNPRPAGDSPLIGAADFSNPRVDEFFFTKVGYAGAFGPNSDWTCPWANWAQPGCLPPTSTQEVLVSGAITSNTTWTPDKEYILNGFVYVKNCATLTIQPGTVVRGDKSTKGALIVTRCSRIVADGAQNEPIVFTTNDPNPTYGSWGGLIILGRASTNSNFMGTAGLGQVEGGVNNAAGDGLYGGGDLPGGAIDNDDSGILRYVRIEYPGIAFQPNNEINGLTMASVGSGTVIDNVQVSYANDDAFEWFGGTVNCKHLIAYRALDDDFDADNGYRGNVQYALSVRDQDIADVSGSNGFEVDNDAQGTNTAPKTAPTFSNVTIVGPNGGGSNLYRRAAHLRRNCEIGIFNSAFIGSYPVGLLIDGSSTLNNANNGTLDVRNSFFYGQGVALDTTPGVILDITAWGNARGLVTGPNSSLALFQDPFNLDVPNTQPTGLSPLLNAAAFTQPRVSIPFFDKVTFAGAFDGSDDWTCGWARFLDVNVNCLVDSDEADKFISDVKLMPTVASTETTLALTLINAADLQVELYDMSGRFHGQVLNAKAVAGEQQYTVNTTDLPAGLYFVRIQAGEVVKTVKLIVAR